MTRFAPPSRIAPGSWLVLLLLVSACATTVNPVTGERELQGLSTEQEIAVGAKQAEKVAQQIGLVENPALQSYIGQLGARLAVHSPRRDLPYTFHVVQMKEPNAFALPGGHVYVSRGLLALSNTETELAGVVGHEIGHVAARHHAQRQTRTQAVGVATVLGAIAAGVFGGGQAAQSAAEFGQMAGTGLIASYGRDQERQADDVGQRIAASAGYDPGGISDFLETLGRSTVLESGQQRQPGFFDTHPSTPERVRNTQQRAQTLSVTPQAPLSADRASYLSRLRGLLLGEDPAQGVFDGSRFLHPGLGFVIDFPDGWRTANSPSQVVAQHPQKTSALALQGQGSGSDPRAAANQFSQKAKVTLQNGRAIRMNGLSAYQAFAQAPDGTVAQFTWVAFGGSIYRIDGIARPEAWQAVRGDLNRTATSLRAITSRERGAIRERRLEVVTARAGETLGALGARAGNAWSLEQTAVANGLETDARLTRGFPVKIAREQPYRPR